MRHLADENVDLIVHLGGYSADGDETWAMDMWDGYPAERQAMLGLLPEVGTPNPIVLTGDIHSNWVADLHTDFDDLSSSIVATEFAGTSISSGGDGQDMTAGGERRLSDNPHIKFYNNQRGYVTAEVTPDLWTSEFKIVPMVT